MRKKNQYQHIYAALGCDAVRFAFTPYAALDLLPFPEPDDIATVIRLPEGAHNPREADKRRATWDGPPTKPVSLGRFIAEYRKVPPGLQDPDNPMYCESCEVGWEPLTSKKAEKFEKKAKK